jgi:hypothetical protein
MAAATRFPPDDPREWLNRARSNLRRAAVRAADSSGGVSGVIDTFGGAPRVIHTSGGVSGVIDTFGGAPRVIVGIGISTAILASPHVKAPDMRG